MFSNIAYEATFFYIGLKLHEQFLQIITSEAFFKGLALIIFGVVLFIAVFRFFSQFSTSTFFARKSFPLSGIFKVIFVFAIGISLLKVDGSIGVLNYERTSWHSNSYIVGKAGELKAEYRVSFIFDLLMRTAQEIGAFANNVVERIFPTVHSQSKAPFFLYRSIMYAGAAQIEDAELRDLISFYIQECSEKAISAFENHQTTTKERILDALFGTNGPADAVDEALSQIELSKYGGLQTNCLSLKQDMAARLNAYTTNKYGKVREAADAIGLRMGSEIFPSVAASASLANHILEEREGLLGIEKGAQVPGFWGSAFQHLSRLGSFPGFATILDPRSGNPIQGASEAAKRAEEFNELLQRAPVLRGVAVMFLCAVFPFLFFWVVAMRWQVLVVWFSQLLGVCLWPAVWTLVYSIMTNVALSVDTMREFGELSNGISLTGATLINQKLYFFFSIMHWLMIGSAAAINSGLFLMHRAVFSETRPEQAPPIAKEIGETAKNVAQAKVGGAIIGGL